jgi:hypothetical protein
MCEECKQEKNVKEKKESKMTKKKGCKKRNDTKYM